MFRKYSVVILLAIFMVPFDGAAYGQAVTKHFCASQDNNWSNGNNWNQILTCDGAVTGVPDDDDKTVIADNKTCNVNISTAIASHLEVRPGATLNIQAGSSGNDRVLTLTGKTAFTTTVNGTVNLLGPYSKLLFTVNNHTLTGDGKIVGRDDSATIDFSDLRLTNVTTIEGNLQIISNDNDDAFINECIVNANGNGVLLFDDSLILQDVEGAVWKITQPLGGGQPVLRFNQLYPGVSLKTPLEGDFEVRDGIVDIQSTIETTGTLFHTGGKIITGSTETALFSDTDSPGAECSICAPG